MPIGFEAKVDNKRAEVETGLSVTVSGGSCKKRRVSTSALGQPSSADHPLNPVEPTGWVSAGAANGVCDLVPSSVGGGNAHSLGASTWSCMELGVSDLVQDSGVGPLGSALGSTSPYSVPPGQEPFGQRFPNFNAPKVSRLPVCDFGELCGARGACSLEEQAWGISLPGVPGGDGVNCHEQRDPAHVATKPAHFRGAGLRNQGDLGGPPFELRADSFSLTSTASTRSSFTRISAAAPRYASAGRVYKVSSDIRRLFNGHRTN